MAHNPPHAGGGQNDSDSDSDDQMFGGLPFQHLTPQHLLIDSLILDDLWLVIFRKKKNLKKIFSG